MKVIFTVLILAVFVSCLEARGFPSKTDCSMNYLNCTSQCYRKACRALCGVTFFMCRQKKKLNIKKRE
ncbi:hypothetical protein ScPMuIL_004817 [Solemya velum]